MEINAHPFHFRDRRQRHRLRRKKNYESPVYRSGLAMGNRIYFTGNYSLANSCTRRKHSFWSIQLFSSLHPQDWAENGVGEDDAQFS